MIKFVSRRPRWARSTWLVVLTLSVAACARSGPSSVPAHPQVSATAERTLFTDSTLFRRICMEADSGLTPSVGRCTPRDQGVRIR